MNLILQDTFWVSKKVWLENNTRPQNTADMLYPKKNSWNLLI